MNNKTHGVLTDAIWIAAIEYADCRVMAVKGRATDVEVADAFVGLITALNEAAPQSPVAPADERAAFVGWLSSSYPSAYSENEAERLWSFEHVAALAWQARARLADAPTVSAAVPNAPLSVFAKGKWTYSETGQAFSAAQMDEAAFVTYRDHFAAPAPPTSAMVPPAQTMLDSNWKGDVDQATYKAGWNDCRDAMLKAMDTPPTSAADAVDAARYRFLRNRMVQTEPPIAQGHVGCGTLDDVIDRYTAASKETT